MPSEKNLEPVTEAPTVKAVTERLRHVRTRLRGHGGDVEVCRVSEDGEVTLEFTGACRGCPAIGFTYGSVVEPALNEMAGVTAVKAAQVNLSPAAIRRIRQLARPAKPGGERL